jgi:hypothetical protein
MCLALLAICMTTLWPVWYIFLDVFVLGLAFFAAEVEPRLARGKAAVMAATSAAALIVTVVVLGGN